MPNRRAAARKCSPSRARPADPVIVEASILALGHAGDGIADVEGRRVFVPGAMPGDRVRIELGTGAQARLQAVLAPGKARAEPACGHFGTCGGCALQHFTPDAYCRFKRDQVIAALRQRGFADPPVGDPIIVLPGSRRRADLSALRRADGGALLGFAERGSHRIVDLERCPVLVPELEALLVPMRALAAKLLSPRGAADFRLTASETGVELVVRTELSLTLEHRERLAAFAEAQKLARAVWGDEIVVQRASPLVRFGGVPVALPPAPFLQATEAGERALVEAARSATAGATRIADLFCGSGAFALPLSERARVHALDSDAPAIEALKRASAQARRPVLAERRDLFHQPLEATELDRYDAVVLDPPRAGARAQAERLAASRVPVVVLASCSPATFARDARILADGGYRLDSVTPIDQFLWSAETELAAALRKD